MADDDKHSVDRILEAALELLSRHGLDELTYRAIAAEAGMSAGTVTYYFASRAELLEAALDRHHERVGRILKPLRDATAPASAAEAAPLVRAIARYAFVHRADVRLRLATWTGRWGLPASRRGDLDNLLTRATRLRWREPWSEPERRIIAQGLVYAAQHLAALCDEDLVEIAKTETPEEAADLVVETMGRLAETFLETE